MVQSAEQRLEYRRKRYKKKKKEINRQSYDYQKKLLALGRLVKHAGFSTVDDFKSFLSNEASKNILPTRIEVLPSKKIIEKIIK